MVENSSLSKRSLDSLRDVGLSGLARQVCLYLLRRVAWKSDEWSKNLDASMLRNRLVRDYGELLKRNEVFRNRHKGQRCFVLGNGPSLRNQDLTPLANEITFVT